MCLLKGSEDMGIFEDKKKDVEDSPHLTREEKDAIKKMYEAYEKALDSRDSEDIALSQRAFFDALWVPLKNVNGETKIILGYLLEKKGMQWLMNFMDKQVETCHAQELFTGKRNLKEVIYKGFLKMLDETNSTREVGISLDDNLPLVNFFIAATYLHSMVSILKGG